ncbi:MAG: hydantoinase/oxoprolinase family protein, partial [Candidatus Rokubacteria bacterium]|nr:hydantoinase/oxoprolinase family protein [Candidatus Rokubacteria bacterium]
MERLAGTLGLPPIKVAWGIHDIVNENMASAARVHIAERGRDPRDYALLCTGGAGPVHAREVARKLGISRVICP